MKKILNILPIVFLIPFTDCMDSSKDVCECFYPCLMDTCELHNTVHASIQYHENRYTSVYSDNNGKPPDTLFQSDFEDVEIINQRYFSNWIDHKFVDIFRFNSVSPYNEDYAFHKIVETDKGNSYYMEAVDDDPNEGSLTRAQVSWYFKEEPGVYHVSYDVKLNEDIKLLELYEHSFTWFTLMELWEARDPDLDGDNAGKCRWTLGLAKNKGVGSPLYWRITAETMQPASIRFDDIWEPVNNTAVDVLLGEWINFDFYLKRGQKDGRIIFKVNGETVFDITDYTQYPKEIGTPMYLRGWNPFKLYTSDDRLDFVRNRGGKIGAYYDNFTWYND